MHPAVKTYCEEVKKRFPDLFKGKAVLDCGSLDINGNNRYLFDDCKYTGIDILKGKNVDVETHVHKFDPGIQYDIVLSTEMLEHDKYWIDTLIAMYFLTKPGGLMLITAAGTGRKEHGSVGHSERNSPATNDYYCNITAAMIVKSIPLEEFSEFEISYVNNDIRFFGIRRL